MYFLKKHVPLICVELSKWAHLYIKIINFVTILFFHLACDIWNCSWNLMSCFLIKYKNH